MDTYENEKLEQQTVQPQQEQPLPPQEKQTPDADGFYHGAGAGMTEDTAADAPTQEQSDAPKEEQIPPSAPQKPKRHIGKKLLKGALLSLLALALVGAGCGISIGLMDRHWQKKNETLALYFQQRVEVLQQQLDSYQKQDNAYISPTVEGLTPSQIYDKNIASVVAINCTVTTVSRGQTYQSLSAGSGFVMT